ncbi:MAG: patatin-like phospholipase family protein [Clostridiaceae bacterium]|nr:patatin-like phospholipase family protein [Clostridiaceae bacterium]
MDIKLDLKKEYGVVLEGGGAKGAYQIGAWKALKEAGVKIRAIAGASVGSLNGALMCMDDLDTAQRIWSNISYSDVMNVNDELMKNLKSKNFRSLNLAEVVNSSFQLIKDGGFDITPLRELMAEAIDEDKIRNSDRKLYAITYSVSERKELAVDINQAEPGTMADMLLASAYFMAFKNEKLQGKRYMDGGGVNNVPLDVLLDRGYRDIIIIRIYGWGFDKERVVKVPEDASIYHIAPRQGLGGILEFDKRQARKNMTMGYYDGLRFLYGLSGRAYYIDAPYGEAYYFDKMMSEIELIKHYIERELDEESYGQLEGYRFFTEIMFPHLADALKLKDGWNYKDLYLAVLEDMAKRMKIKRFKVYSVDELVKKIYVKVGLLDSILPM